MKGRLLYHVFPLLVAVFPMLWFYGVGSKRMLEGEAGIVENATVLFLVIAIGFCIAGVSKANRLGLGSLVKAWLFVLILGAAYFALEEISYGQHLFGWTAGETFQELNDQDETNLHNIHAIFDQVPRGLLTLAILVGGVIMPLYRHFRGTPLEPSNRFYWQWPTMDCVTIGLLAILIRPALTVIDVDFINTGEMKENLFALFIMLYCVSLHARLRQHLAAGAAASSAAPG